MQVSMRVDTIRRAWHDARLLLKSQAAQIKIDPSAHLGAVRICQMLQTLNNSWQEECYLLKWNKGKLIFFKWMHLLLDLWWQSLDSKEVKETMKFGSGSVMMWGCMTFEGLSMFCKIERKMNTYHYLNILQRDLLKTIEAYDLNLASLTFQHDNDPQTHDKNCSLLA